jgi:hypothetical protein
MVSDQVDTSGLIEVLNSIASTDEVALASTSSVQLDDWVAKLQEWYTTLSSLPSDNA